MRKRIHAGGVSPQSAVVFGGQIAQFKAAVSGDAGVLWSVNGIPGGDIVVRTIDSAGNYTAPDVTPNVAATVSAHQKVMMKL